jgi:hypothetical protein
MVYEIFILGAMQFFFTVGIYTYSDENPKFVRDTILNLVMISASLLQHIYYAANINSGMDMMKYVMVHPDHFTSPGSAFFIGFVCMWNILIA